MSVLFLLLYKSIYFLKRKGEKKKVILDAVDKLSLCSLKYKWNKTKPKKHQHHKPISPEWSKKTIKKKYFKCLTCTNLQLTSTICSRLSKGNPFSTTNKNKLLLNWTELLFCSHQCYQQHVINMQGAVTSE